MKSKSLKSKLNIYHIYTWVQIIIVMNNNVCELYVLDNDVLQNVIECNYNEF